MKISGRHILFAGVLVILAGVIVYRLQNPFIQQTTDQLTYTAKKGLSAKAGSNRAAADQEGKKKTMSVFDLFLNKPQISGAMHTDLFAEYRLPVKKRVSVKPVLKKQEPADPKPLRKDPLAEARKAITSYKLYGTFQEAGKKAVFLSKDKLVLVARIGDRLEGKYLIQDIQDTYITFKPVEVNQTLRLDMREFKDE